MSGQEPLLNPAVEEFSGDDLNFEATFTQKIFDFLEKQKLQDASPVFYLYKYEDVRSGGMKSFIQKYRDCDPPDEDDIGKEFGSGRYLLCMSIPRSKTSDSIMRAYRFRVHSRYDAIIEKKQEREARHVEAQAVHAQPSGPSFNDAFLLFERMFTMIGPLLNKPKDENISAILSQNYLAMGDMMKRSLLDNYKMIADMSKNMLNQGETNLNTMTTTIEDEIEDKENSIIETLLPLIQEWLPKLIGGGVQSQVIGSAIKNAPQFKQIVNDKAELMKIIDYLDQTQGTEKTDQVLSALQVKRITSAKRSNRQGVK